MKIKRVHLNLLVDVAIGLAFLAEAVSGLVLWVILPRGGYQGGRGVVSDRFWLVARSDWLSLHDWGAIIIIARVLLHIALHWRWFVCVIRRLFRDVSAAVDGAKECVA